MKSVILTLAMLLLSGSAFAASDWDVLGFNDQSLTISPADETGVSHRDVQSALQSTKAGGAGTKL